MGTDAHVVVVDGPPDAMRLASAAVADLEQRWSRFLPGSEISLLNAAAGRPVAVSAPTFELIDRAVEAWHATCGWFDPTVLSAVLAAGYDRSYESLGPVARTVSPSPVAGRCGEILLDRANLTVALPDGTGFDAGGIGKGFAADLVTAELRAAGAAGAYVNLGGDLRVTGAGPTDDGWVIGVEHPSDRAREIARVAVADGGIATTSRLARTWQTAGGMRHHLIDPFTGEPAFHGLTAVTVIAGEAWWAEVLAKAAYLAGPAEARTVVAAGGATGVLVDDCGEITLLDGLEDFRA